MPGRFTAEQCAAARAVGHEELRHESTFDGKPAWHDYQNSVFHSFTDGSDELPPVDNPERAKRWKGFRRTFGKIIEQMKHDAANQLRSHDDVARVLRERNRDRMAANREDEQYCENERAAQRTAKQAARREAAADATEVVELLRHGHDVSGTPMLANAMRLRGLKAVDRAINASYLAQEQLFVQLMTRAGFEDVATPPWLRTSEVEASVPWKDAEAKLGCNLLEAAYLLGIFGPHYQSQQDFVESLNNMFGALADFWEDRPDEDMRLPSYKVEAERMACDVARLGWSVARLTERVCTFDSWEVDDFTYRNVYLVDVPTPNAIDSRDVEQANARFAEWKSLRDGPPPPRCIDGCAYTLKKAIVRGFVQQGGGDILHYFPEADSPSDLEWDPMSDFDVTDAKAMEMACSAWLKAHEAAADATDADPISAMWTVHGVHDRVSRASGRGGLLLGNDACDDAYDVLLKVVRALRVE